VTVSRWLAIYVDRHGNSRAAIIRPKADGDLPFGADEFALGLADYDGEPATLVQLPGDPEFRPLVVDVNDDAELPVQFIDL
jgi:hypothetical protein